MPQYTEHFNLIQPVGDDIFNPLTLQNPAITSIDGQMYTNQNNSIPTATYAKSGNVHTIQQTVATAPMFRFTAGANFRTGDTFTVNGQVVTAVLPTGDQLPDYAFRTNSNVLCCLSGGQLTIYTTKTDATSDIVNLIYPVGSIIQLNSTTDPNTIYSGTTWVKIEGRFILGSSDAYPIASTGGEASVTLTTSQIPSHNHALHIYPTSSQASGYGLTQAAGFQNQVLIQNLNTQSGTLCTSTGGGSSHNNMPPYKVANIWERTA